MFIRLHQLLVKTLACQFDGAILAASPSDDLVVGVSHAKVPLLNKSRRSVTPEVRRLKVMAFQFVSVREGHGAPIIERYMKTFNHQLKTKYASVRNRTNVEFRVTSAPSSLLGVCAERD